MSMHRFQLHSCPRRGCCSPGGISCISVSLASTRLPTRPSHGAQDRESSRLPPCSSDHATALGSSTRAAGLKTAQTRVCAARLVDEPGKQRRGSQHHSSVRPRALIRGPRTAAEASGGSPPGVLAVDLEGRVTSPWLPGTNRTTSCPITVLPLCCDGSDSSTAA